MNGIVAMTGGRPLAGYVPADGFTDEDLARLGVSVMTHEDMEQAFAEAITSDIGSKIIIDSLGMQDLRLDDDPHEKYIGIPGRNRAERRKNARFVKPRLKKR